MKRTLIVASTSIIAISLLTGCETVKVQCPSWVKEVAPIKPSRTDTLETRRQVATLNDAYEGNCK